MRTLFLILIAITYASCACQKSIAQPQSGKMQITQVTPNTFQHISYLQTEDFGKVACNGLIVKTGMRR